MSDRRLVATTVGLTVGGGLMILFVDGILLSQILAAPVFGPVWTVLTGIGAAIIGTAPAPVDVATGSDLAWAWQMHAGWIACGAVIGAVWGAVALRSSGTADPGGVQRVSRILSAIALATLVVAMLLYGLAKVIPAQVGYMNLPAYQLQAVGDAEPFAMLWGYMATSTPYTVITGLIETAAALLLVPRRTRTAGALLAVVSLTQIVLLNVFYDVPVKLLAFELLLIAVLLTRPWAPLLRAIFPAPQGSPTRRAAAARAAGTCALVVLLAVTASKNADRVELMNTARDARDGVWRATELSIDGAPARATGGGPAWTSIAITLRGSADRPATGSAQDSLVTQTPDGAVEPWGLRLDGDGFVVRAGAGSQPVRLSAVLAGPDALVLSGTVDGHRLEGRYARRVMERSDAIRFVQAPFDRSRPRL